MNNLQQNRTDKVSSFNDYMESRLKPPRGKELNMRDERQYMFNKLCLMVLKLKSLKILHGDLHPWNVYVIEKPGQKPKLTIIDFGRSINLPVRTRAMTAAGRVTGHNVRKNKYYGNKFYTTRFANGEIPVIIDESKLRMFASAYKVKYDEAMAYAIAKVGNSGAGSIYRTTPTGRRRVI
jgi:hypothetical protein